jgi:hypothetical protein
MPADGMKNLGTWLTLSEDINEGPLITEDDSCPTQRFDKDVFVITNPLQCKIGWHRPDSQTALWAPRRDEMGKFFSPVLGNVGAEDHNNWRTFAKHVIGVDEVLGIYDKNTGEFRGCQASGARKSSTYSGDVRVLYVDCLASLTYNLPRGEIEISDLSWNNLQANKARVVHINRELYNRSNMKQNETSNYTISTLHRVKVFLNDDLLETECHLVKTAIDEIIDKMDYKKKVDEPEPEATTAAKEDDDDDEDEPDETTTTASPGKTTKKPSKWKKGYEQAKEYLKDKAKDKAKDIAKKAIEGGYDETIKKLLNGEDPFTTTKNFQSESGMSSETLKQALRKLAEMTVSECVNRTTSTGLASEQEELRVMNLTSNINMSPHTMYKIEITTETLEGSIPYAIKYNISNIDFRSKPYILPGLRHFNLVDANSDDSLETLKEVRFPSTMLITSGFSTTTSISSFKLKKDQTKCEKDEQQGEFCYVGEKPSH